MTFCAPLHRQIMNIWIVIEFPRYGNHVSEAAADDAKILREGRPTRRPVTVGSPPAGRTKSDTWRGACCWRQRHVRSSKWLHYTIRLLLLLQRVRTQIFFFQISFRINLYLCAFWNAVRKYTIIVKSKWYLVRRRHGIFGGWSYEWFSDLY